MEPLRRIPPYIYLADLFRGRRVLEIGCGDGTSTHYLAECGAAQVLGVDRSVAAIETARGKHRLANLGFRTADYGALELEDRSFDVVCVPAGGELVRWIGFLEEVRRVLARDGNLVVCVASADRPDARGGVSYHELSTRLASLYGAVRMVGVTPFVGFSLVEFADEEEIGELELDTSLTSLGSGRDAVTDYVGVTGPLTGGARGFMIVELPPAEGIAVVVEARGGEIGRGEAPAKLEKQLREAEAAHAEAMARLRDLETAVTTAQRSASAGRGAERGDEGEIRRRLARAVEERTAAEGEVQQLRQRLERAEEEVGRVAGQAALELGEARRETQLAAARAVEAEARLVQSRGGMVAAAAESALEENEPPARVEPPRLERPTTLPGIAPVLIPPAPSEFTAPRLELQLRDREAEVAKLTSERQALEWRVAELAGRLTALEAEPPAQSPTELLLRAAEEHAQEARALRHALDDLRAENEELRARDFETVIADARASAADADRRADEVDAENRAIRQRLAECEGKLLGEAVRAQAAAPPPAPEPAAVPSAQVAELEAALAEQKAAATGAAAAAETASTRWKAAEAKTDELWRKIGEMQRELEQNREQGVETARAQRHAAQVALTRAVDEASKKLVSVKDELLRANREIDGKAADNERLRGELAQLTARSAAEHASALATPLAMAGLAGRLEEVLAVVRVIDDGLAEEERRLDRLGGALAALRAEGIEGTDGAPVADGVPVAGAEGAEGVVEEPPAGTVEEPWGAPEEAAPGEPPALDPEVEAWLQGREQRVQELSAELGERDAELALLHGVLAGARQRIADMIDLIQRTCDELAGRSEGEIAAALSQLAAEAGTLELRVPGES